MVGRLFTLGQCKKAEFFDVFVNTLVTAGWEDISSNPTTDFMVFNSKGEDGTRNLFLQVRNWMTTSEVVSSVITTNYSAFGVRLPLGYTPTAPTVSEPPPDYDEGTSGPFVPVETPNPGVFLRPATTWNSAFNWPAASYDKTVLINYAIYADKDRIIYIITPPIASTINSLVTFIGLPDEMYCAENNSDGMIYASSFGNGIYTAGTLAVANNPSELGIMSTDIQARAVKANLPTKNPNAANKYILTDMVYENATEGTRGKINSILFLPNSNVLPNDIIMDGDNKYKVAICQAVVTGYVTSFPSIAFAYRIE